MRGHLPQARARWPSRWPATSARLGRDRRHVACGGARARGGSPRTAKSGWFVLRRRRDYENECGVGSHFCCDKPGKHSASGRAGRHRHKATWPAVVSRHVSSPPARGTARTARPRRSDCAADRGRARIRARKSARHLAMFGESKTNQLAWLRVDRARPSSVRSTRSMRGEGSSDLPPGRSRTSVPTSARTSGQ